MFSRADVPHYYSPRVHRPPRPFVCCLPAGCVRVRVYLPAKRPRCSRLSFLLAVPVVISRLEMASSVSQVGSTFARWVPPTLCQVIPTIGTLPFVYVLVSRWDSFQCSTVLSSVEAIFISKFGYRSSTSYSCFLRSFSVSALETLDSGVFLVFCNPRILNVLDVRPRWHLKIAYERTGTRFFVASVENRWILRIRLSIPSLLETFSSPTADVRSC